MHEYKDPFAEIEYDDNPIQNISSPSDLYRKLHERGVIRGEDLRGKIPQRDPVKDVLYDMRSLASNDPYAWNSARLFYKQGKFMEDFNDVFEDDAFMYHYSPCYQRMSFDQLRTFFTWRTQYRHGNPLDVDLSYLLLYCYELLSLIGMRSKDEALAQLLILWQHYRKDHPELDDHVPGWIKDFHIYYMLEQSFEDFVRQHDFADVFFNDLLLEKNFYFPLSSWKNISAYNFEKSKFYDAHEQMFTDAFYAALDGVRSLCAARDTCIEHFVFQHVHHEFSWTPFRQAVFYPWEKQPDRKIIMPLKEIYLCTANKWAAQVTNKAAHTTHLIGYILKQTEAICREFSGFKHKLRVEIDGNKAVRDVLRRKGIKAKELEDSIVLSVKAYHRKATQIVVNVDHASLLRIREAAKDTQEKLIVEEPTIKDTISGIAVHTNPLMDNNAHDVTAHTENIDEIIGDANENSDKMNASIYDDILDEDQNEWQMFIRSLSDIEYNAIKQLLMGVDAKTFADAQDIMVEVLIDGINEKGMDIVGDNLIDDDYAVYDDYLEQIESIYRNE